MPLALDGSASILGSSGTSVATGTLACANAGNVICVVVVANGSTPSSVTATGATFTKRAEQVSPNISLWTGYASGTFSGAITVTFAGTATFATVHAFGVSGCPASSYFDANVSCPNVGGASPRTISTTAADTLVIGCFRMNGTASPATGTGFTTILSGGFALTEYKIVSTAQSNLSVPIGPDGSGSNGAIADALVMSTGPSGGVLAALQEQGAIG